MNTPVDVFQYFLMLVSAIGMFVCFLKDDTHYMTFWGFLTIFNMIGAYH